MYIHQYFLGDIMPAKPGRIETIDAMRVLAIIAVIQIHTPWYWRSDAVSLDSATLLDQLARFAVPFFFVVSGYLWSARCESTGEYWTRSLAICKRALLIFVFWSLLYAVRPSLHVIRHEGVSSLMTQLVSIVYPFNAARLTNAVLEGTQWHLWFLPALALAALISGALLARRRERTLFLVAVTLFVVGLAGSAYSSTPYGFASQFNFRNGPFFSLIMFVSGYAIHRYGQSLALLPIGVGLAIGGFALQLLEATWIHQRWGAQFSHDYVVGTYFFGLGMSMIALSNTPLLRIRALASIGPLILGVYACHFFFVDALRPLDRVVHQPHVREILYLATVFCLALATSFILAQWPRTRQFVT